MHFLQALSDVECTEQQPLLVNIYVNAKKYWNQPQIFCSLLCFYRFASVVSQIIYLFLCAL